MDIASPKVKTDSLSSSFKTIAKRAVKALPFLRSYFRRKQLHLDRLAADIDRLILERDALRKELNGVSSELEAIAAERNTLAEQLDGLRSELSTLRSERDLLDVYRQQLDALFAPPGHHYSPIVSIEEVAQEETRVFTVPPGVQGIALNDDVQLKLLDELALFYADLPFPEHKMNHLHYYYENEMYSYTDAITLFGMIRYLSPKRIIEIGSGFSSCVILDTNRLFFENGIDCTFVEPQAERLLSLVDPEERAKIRLFPTRLQDVTPQIFDGLQEGDILFVDSSHIIKTGSDVDLLLKDVLPSLAPGVYIHFHDIFFPFEYPKAWVYEGRSWNEAYALRAFLQYNEAFSIRFFADYLSRFHRERMLSRLPLCARNTGGNIWLRKEI